MPNGSLPRVNRPDICERTRKTRECCETRFQVSLTRPRGSFIIYGGQLSNLSAVVVVDGNGKRGRRGGKRIVIIYDTDTWSRKSEKLDLGFAV